MTQDETFVLLVKTYLNNEMTVQGLNSFIDELLQRIVLNQGIPEEVINSVLLHLLYVRGEK